MHFHADILGQRIIEIHFEWQTNLLPSNTSEAEEDMAQHQHALSK